MCQSNETDQFIALFKAQLDALDAEMPPEKKGQYAAAMKEYIYIIPANGRFRPEVVARIRAQIEDITAKLKAANLNLNYEHQLKWEILGESA